MYNDVYESLVDINYKIGHHIDDRDSLIKKLNEILPENYITYLFYIDNINETIKDPIIKAIQDDNIYEIKRYLKSTDMMIEYEVSDYNMKLLIDYDLMLDNGLRYPFIERYRKINLLELSIILKAEKCFNYLIDNKIFDITNEYSKSYYLTSASLLKNNPIFNKLVQIFGTIFVYNHRNEIRKFAREFKNNDILEQIKSIEIEVEHK